MSQDISLFSIPAEKLGAGTKVKVRILPETKDLSYDMAIQILLEVVENNKKGKHTTLIMPVGPIGQYEIMVRLINEHKISFKNVHFFQMDEYLTRDMKYIPEDSPMSFTGIVKKQFLNLLDADVSLPASQYYVPQPGNEGAIAKRIEELGGIDSCYGGMGITGHIAFNEPASPDDPITDAQFRELPTRILRLTPETLTINSSTTAGGTIDLVPEWAVTIGMKEILASRKIRLYLNRNWQSGIVRKILHGPISRFAPCSFLQEHPDTVITLTKESATPPRL